MMSDSVLKKLTEEEKIECWKKLENEFLPIGIAQEMPNFRLEVLYDLIYEVNATIRKINKDV